MRRGIRARAGEVRPVSAGNSLTRGFAVGRDNKRKKREKIKKGATGGIDSAIQGGGTGGRISMWSYSGLKFINDSRRLLPSHGSLAAIRER